MLRKPSGFHAFVSPTSAHPAPASFRPTPPGRFRIRLSHGVHSGLGLSRLPPHSGRPRLRSAFRGYAGPLAASLRPDPVLRHALAARSGP